MRAHPLPAGAKYREKILCRSRGTHSSFEELGILPRKVGRIFASGKARHLHVKTGRKRHLRGTQPERRPAASASSAKTRRLESLPKK